MSYIKEDFQNLDVMNNFMMNALATNEQTRDKFCRLMIKGLLGIEVSSIKVIAESIKLPDSPDKRGVRLDIEVDEYASEDGDKVATIYDLEPHRDIENYYPKLNRFRQAMIDKNLLASGEKDYNNLPNLYIVSITNYDPFGYDYMQYSFKKVCAEVPDLCYNDGVVHYYFNTAGTKGGSKELKAFLTYLEESVAGNATDIYTKDMNALVDYIKSSETIRGDYMTMDYLLKKYKNEAFNNGKDLGRKETLHTLENDLQHLMNQGMSSEQIVDEMIKLFASKIDEEVSDIS